MNREINLYELSKEEQDIISKYQSAKVGMVNKFNAGWYKELICKIFDNVDVINGEIGQIYKYWLYTRIKDTTIEFGIKKDAVIVRYTCQITQSQTQDVKLDFIAVNYNMKILKEIKEELQNDR
jgi:hypothetical protein